MGLAFVDPVEAGGAGLAVVGEEFGSVWCHRKDAKTLMVLRGIRLGSGGDEGGFLGREDAKGRSFF